MKLVTGEVMREVDRRAIEEFGVSGLALMERAGCNCAELIDARYGMVPLLVAVIVAGKGNNGGDGFVIARLLAAKGWEVQVFLLAEPATITGDAKTNLERLPAGLVTCCPDVNSLALLEVGLADATVVVDAMFGTGLAPEVAGHYAAAIDLLNAAGRPTVAVDIPSGIHAGSGRMLGTAVRAARTVTFGLAKVGHVQLPGAEFTGELFLTDIGIPQTVLAEAGGVEYLEEEAIRPLLQQRAAGSHKGSFGHCLIVAGATGKTGAAAMAANSAVRGGAGLVTLAVPASIHAILELKTTEAMTMPLTDDGRGYLAGDCLAEVARALAARTVGAIGPGLGWHGETADLVKVLVRTSRQPLVIDADGLNALSEEPAVLAASSSPAIVLTPHPGEMARLAGTCVTAVEADRLGVATDFARQHGVYLLLKGARTVLAAPDGRLAINGSGNPGMASGGMGDVLTGIIVSLLGQHYSAWDACRIGVYIHGYAANLVADEKGEIGMNASDVQ
ncbi:MAG TPA: NAD(P)H-hydrate dehydratase, partial [Geobacteraceae bacterium]